MADRPLIAVSACVKPIDGLDFHAAADPYLLAVKDGAQAMPVVLPALGADDALLDRLDGLLLTGSPSNVEPLHYGGPASAPGTAHDPRRDATILPLIRAALASGVPLLAICRGFQELNVALGGSLHQRLDAVPGMIAHRPFPSGPLDGRFAPAHAVNLVAGGLLADLAEGGQAMVNSLHGQGVARLAEGLVVEATAPDGLVEAARFAAAPDFALGVQWHPEWRWAEQPLSRAIFRAFGRAAGTRQAMRLAHS